MTRGRRETTGLSGRPSRRGGERGSVLLEAAIVLPLLLFLILGAIDYGLLFRDDLTVSQMTRAAARSGSAAGQDALADYQLLSSMASAATALQGGISSIQYIVVFKADCTTSCDSGSPQSPPVSSVPSACIQPAAIAAGGSSGLCNVYSNAYLLTPAQSGTLTPANFGCKSGATTLADNMWCPTTRGVTEAKSDYLGVYVKLTHNWVTKFFGSAKTVTDTVVFRLEPQTFT